MARRDALAALQPTGSTHAGLWLNRYLADHEAAGAKQAHIDALLHPRPPAAPAGYRRFFERWRQAVAALPPCTRLARASVAGRMVVGLGAEAVLETSLCLHRTYGVPYIPGSALKGLAAAAAHRAVEDPAWRKGGREKDRDSHRIAFGDTESAGYVTFHDALWWPEGELPLNLDVMTVHHSDYYLSGNAPPADWDNPVPVPFVSARGSYLLALTGPEEWADAALEILSDALATDGIGAKTAAGYGRMKVTPLAPAGAAAPGDAKRGAGKEAVRSSAPQGDLRAEERTAGTLSWEPWARSIHFGNAEHEVLRLLAALAEEDRGLAARHLVEQLKRKALLDPKRKDKQWVVKLLAAAQE
jgi:CRISPR-associated protein Cmr6